MRVQTGMVFGHLTVYSLLPRNRAIVFCACGIIKITRREYLQRGDTKSCGCMKPQHGHACDGRPTPTYRAWNKMRERCNNPNHANFSSYGGRGITVCDRWKSFENFLEDMGERPEGLSIDRIDVNGNYEPENCRWADAETQANNTQRSRKITYQGESMTIAQWERRTSLPVGNRLYKGWTEEEAIGIPVGCRRADRRH